MANWRVRGTEWTTVELKAFRDAKQPAYVFISVGDNGHQLRLSPADAKTLRAQLAALGN